MKMIKILSLFVAFIGCFAQAVINEGWVYVSDVGGKGRADDFVGIYVICDDASAGYPDLEKAEAAFYKVHNEKTTSTSSKKYVYMMGETVTNEITGVGGKNMQRIPKMCRIYYVMPR